MNIFRAGSGWNSILVLLDSCLQTCMTYTIVECTVNKLLMMGREIVRKSSAPYRIFYFVLFHFIFNYIIYPDSSVGTAVYISQSNKQEGQITCHSHSNNKVIGSAENCC